jgi:hypothetical protein
VQCLVLVLLTACTSNDCPPSQAGDELVVRVSSQYYFDELNATFTLRGQPYGDLTFVLPLPARTYYDFGVAKALHGEGPDAVAVAVYWSAVVVAHAETSGIAYSDFDGADCVFRADISLTAGP